MRRNWGLLAATALAVAGAVLALGGGFGRRIEAAGYDVRPAGVAVDAPAVTLSVVVPAGTQRARLAAIRDELRARYSAARLVRVSFYDDRAAAESPQGPDAPAPDPSWWRHYVAQYNLNRNTGYEWFGRLYPHHSEPWE